MRNSELKIRSFLFRNPQSTFRNSLGAELHLVKSEIETPLSNQFRMGSYLSDLSLMKNDDPISMLDRGETVGDDDRCPPFEQLCQALLN